MLRTLGRVLLGAFGRSDEVDGLPETPGPEVRVRLDPPPDELVDAYAAWSGAPPGRWENALPPHLFPQWALPVSSRTLRDAPFPLTRVLNQGCELDVREPLPRGADLRVRARLETAEQRASGVRLRQSVHTGTEESPGGLAAEILALVPSRGARRRSARKRERPVGFEEIGRWDATVSDAREFCWLTGDLNPIHWIPAAARKAGFARPILHGFGIFARTWEVLEDFGDGSGNGGPVTRLGVRFTRPAVLPAALHVLLGERDDGGERAVRLLDASGQVCLVGSCAFGVVAERPPSPPAPDGQLLGCDRDPPSTER